MLKIIFIISLLYFLFRNRIDFYLLFFLSNVLYGSHVIYGKVWIPPYGANVQINAELTLIIVFLTLIAFTFITDRKTYNVHLNAENKVKYINKIWVQITLGITWLLFMTVILYVFIKGGGIGKSNLKPLYLILLFFQVFSGASFILTWTLDRPINKIIGSIPIIFVLLTGARAFAVISFIAVFMLRLYNKKIFSSLFKIIPIIIIPVLAVLQRTWHVLILLHPKHIIDYLFVAFGSYEWGQVGWNLNAATDASYSSVHSYSSVLLGSIPLLHRFVDIGPRGFHYYLYYDLNPGFHYGLGGTFWGESYVIGGFLGVFIHLLIVLFTIHLLTKYLFGKNDSLYPIVLITIVWLSFYLPRNDMFKNLAVLKNLLMFNIFYYLLYTFIPKRKVIMKRIH